jgi:RimJ/RimL family protein N-acetyltransferase
VTDRIELLEGKLVNLKLMEKEDVPLAAEWMSNPEVLGEYQPLEQVSKSEFKRHSGLRIRIQKTLGTEDKHEEKDFIIEKKDGTKIGMIAHFYVLHVTASITPLEIGSFLLPNERGKGYTSEAVAIMVDYLFLSKNTMRIQATTDTRNLSSQKVLEKTGFKKEGTLRKYVFIRGELRDAHLYSILREEWKEPRILTRKRISPAKKGI